MLHYGHARPWLFSPIWEVLLPYRHSFAVNDRLLEVDPEATISSPYHKHWLAVRGQEHVSFGPRLRWPVSGGCQRWGRKTQKMISDMC